MIHIHKGLFPTQYTLDGRHVRTITTFLFHTGGNEEPARLVANLNKSFEGIKFDGYGFIFESDGESRGGTSIDVMNDLLLDDERKNARERQNREIIFPLLGGEDVLDDARQVPRKYIIDFDDLPLTRVRTDKSWCNADEKQRQSWLKEGFVPVDYEEPVASDWPDLLSIVEQKVRPERLRKAEGAARRFWWRFVRQRPEMHKAIRGLKKVVVRPFTSTHFAVSTFASNQHIVFNKTLVVFAFHQPSMLAVLNSSIHEI
jgi:hypothetical protein